jgi:hypothetical protein
MKKAILILAIVVLLLVAITPAVIAKPAEKKVILKFRKADICHVTGHGEMILINVAAAAVDAHLAHGDKMADTDSNGEPFCKKDIPIEPPK